MTIFHVGQKVVLVDDTERPGSGDIDRYVARMAGAIYPTKGLVYTVRSVGLRSSDNKPFLLLAEIDNRLATLVLGYKKEAGFAAWRFRPVVERKTDISMFKAMLNTTKEPANA